METGRITGWTCRRWLRSNPPLATSVAGTNTETNPYLYQEHLFDKTQQTMPATAPGSLTGPQTADILAYMFSVSAYPTGASELPSTTEALKSIEFDVKQ